MNKKTLYVLAFSALLATTYFAGAAAAQACTVFHDAKYVAICTRITDVSCQILLIVQSIAAIVGAVVIALSGYQWISSGLFDDPKRRSDAKERIIYTIVGLIVVLVAVQLVNLLFSGSIVLISCP
jgi:hypothetical protein